MSVATSRERSISRVVEEATMRETASREGERRRSCELRARSHPPSRRPATPVLPTPIKLLSIRIDGLDLELRIKEDRL